MFSLAINFGPTGVAWSFLFTKEESLNLAVQALTETDSGYVLIEDEFGSKATVAINQIHGWLVEKMDMTKGAIVFRNIHMKRIEAEFQSQFQNDPALARLRGEQSAILSPFLRSGRAS